MLILVSCLPLLYHFMLCLSQTPPSLPHLCILLQVSRFQGNLCTKQLKLLMLLAYNESVNYILELSAF